PIRPTLAPRRFSGFRSAALFAKRPHRALSPQLRPALVRGAARPCRMCPPTSSSSPSNSAGKSMPAPWWSIPMPSVGPTPSAASFAASVAPEIFERVLALATQLAAEGREGRPVGTLFVVGDSERVLAQSRSLVLNPFQGHPESARNILDPAVEETIKEFAALD